MNCISSDGPMKLMQVVNVYSKINGSRNINEIHFQDSVLAVMNQHAFSGYRDDDSIIVKANQVKKGDKIWIDSSTFSSDGSLRKKRRREMLIDQAIESDPKQDKIVEAVCNYTRKLIRRKRCFIL